MIGVYCLLNSEDYYFTGGGINGAWAGVMFGTTPFAGHNGGIAASFFRVHFGFSPYAFYQTSDSSTSVANAGGADIHLYSCSLEQIGEAVIDELPSINGVTAFFMDRTAFTWATSKFVLPSSIVATPQAYAFWFGNLSIFRSVLNDMPGFTEFKTSPVNVNGKIAFLNVDSTQYGESQLDAFMGSITIVTPSNNIDNRRYYSGRDYLKRPEKAIKSNVNPSPNLLLNPEIASNWTLNKITASIASLSSLRSGPLAGTKFSRQFYEELGQNPNAVVLTAKGSGWNAKLNFDAYPFNAGSGYPSISFWVVCANRTIPLRARLDAGDFIYVYDGVVTMVNKNVATKVFGLGQRPADKSNGDNFYYSFETFLNAASAEDTIYIFGLMSSMIDTTPYNPYPGASIDGPLYLTTQPVVAKPPLSGGASGGLEGPAGYIQININGTVRRIPYY